MSVHHRSGSIFFPVFFVLFCFVCVYVILFFHLGGWSIFLFSHTRLVSPFMKYGENERAILHDFPAFYADPEAAGNKQNTLGGPFCLSALPC